MRVPAAYCGHIRWMRSRHLQHGVLWLSIRSKLHWILNGLIVDTQSWIVDTNLSRKSDFSGLLVARCSYW
jgi:hypothetical protein